MMVKENLVRDGKGGNSDGDLQQCFVLRSWKVAESFPSDTTMYRCYPIKLIINQLGCRALTAKPTPSAFWRPQTGGQFAISPSLVKSSLICLNVCNHEFWTSATRDPNQRQSKCY